MALMNRGLLALKLGRPDECESELRKAVASSPEWYDAQLTLAIFLSERNKQDEALLILNSLQLKAPAVLARLEEVRAFLQNCK